MRFISNIFFSIPVIIIIGLVVLIGIAFTENEAATAYAGMAIIYFGFALLGLILLCLVVGFVLRAKSKRDKGDRPKPRRFVLGSCAIAVGAIFIGWELIFWVKVVVLIPDQWAFAPFFLVLNPRFALAVGALIFGIYELRKPDLNAAS